uniref:Putative chitin deacetylase n=1 Tax=Flammulina velutipes TaxID=38945 RepID=G8A521_FLAVE|nr:putative chitin deacetylase [Flammulina velutipes]
MLLSTVAFSLAILTVPTVSLPSIAALPSLVTSCTVPNTAALTFDDGPYIYSLCNGCFANIIQDKCIYDTDSMERVQHAYASGHQIASHGWSHTSLPSLSADQGKLPVLRIVAGHSHPTVELELSRVDAYGNTNDQVLSITAARGQTAVNWNLDAEDWNGLSAAQTQANNVVDKPHAEEAVVKSHALLIPSTITMLFSAIALNALTSRGAKGTFFFNQCIYDQGAIDQIKYAYNAGHQVASHTWGHKDLTSLTWDQIHDEMWRVELALQRIVGVQPAFMRPPYGNYDDEVLYASYIRGQKVVIWDFDSGDSVGASAAESKERYRTTSLNRPSTLLALNHETIESTAHDVIPYAIDRLQSAGYRLVTVAECLGEQPYQWTGAPQTPTSDWRC